MMSISKQNAALALIGATGTVLFAFFFALTFHTPEWVEKFSAEFIEREASKRIDERIDAVQPPGGDNALARMAGALYRKNEEAIERHRELLRLRVHERMADAIAEIRDLDCTCRDKWAQWLTDGTTTQMQLLEQANEQITEFIQGTYANIVVDFKRDVRVFTAANAIMFVLVLLVLRIKPQARLQLFVPGLLLATVTVICSYFYIFRQNWLLTVIYQDYLGFTYLAYLGVVFALLCDIVLNRARVTTEIVNEILSAIGSAASAVPC